jgi:glutathione S-transferase
MSSQIKPIKVWGRGPSPNPLKIAIILKELNIPYEIVHVPFEDIKKPEYVAINPNGRLPAIQDPNTGITLWESGAIVEYLIERYDTQHQLSFAPGTREAYHAKQWLFFQVSGQGPYYGQMIWFKKWHPEPVPSAVQRYIKEINRVTGVLEGYLAQKKADAGDSHGPWLVGNKLSYADLAFIPWQWMMVSGLIDKDEYDQNNFPHVTEWYGKMTSRDAVKTAIKEVTL